MGKLHKKEYTEYDIQQILKNYISDNKNVKYLFENLFLYDWESDFVYITKSDIVFEFEIKTSKADFKNDFKNKQNKHLLLEDKNIEPKKKPNYFYYVVPENLISVEDIPEYAGLVYVINYYPFLEFVKKAPKLHNNKCDADFLKLTDKFYYNYRKWKETVNQKKDENDKLIEQINELCDKPMKEKKSYIALKEQLEKEKQFNKLNEIKLTEYGQNIKYAMENERWYRKVIHYLTSLLKENNIPYDIDSIGIE